MVGVWLALSSLGPVALAAEESPVPGEGAVTEGDAWRNGSRAPIEGIIGLEATLEAMGSGMDEVVLLNATWAGDAHLVSTGEQAVDPDLPLVVQMQRVTDGAVLATATDARTPWKPTRNSRSRVCGTAETTDARPVGLVTWDDRLRPQGGTGQGRSHARRTSLYYLGGDERRALVELAPGESVTVVELIEGDPRQPERQIRVERGSRMLTVTEGDTVQQVCLEFLGGERAIEGEVGIDEVELPWQRPDAETPWTPGDSARQTAPSPEPAGAGGVAGGDDTWG